MLNDNSDKEEIEKMWKMLDDLAEKDPEGYKRYTEKLEKEAIMAKRMVKPSYYVRGLDSSSSIHYLNICKSVAVPKGNSSNDIPILISHKREFHEDEGPPCFVYDAVYNPSTSDKKDLEADLLNLACDCIYQLFSVKLIPSTFEIVRDEYFGPYGWNDKTGAAVEKEEWKKRVAIAEAAKKLSQDILKNSRSEKLCEIRTRPEKVEEPLPNIVIPSSATQSNIGNRTLIIEEVDDPSPIELLSLAFEQVTGNTALKIIITLPELISGDDLDFAFYEPNRFVLKIKDKYILDHVLPAKFCTTPTCKIVKNKFGRKISAFVQRHFVKKNPEELPKMNKRKFLVIFDLNGTLICRVKQNRKEEREAALANPNCPEHDFTIKRARVYIRPHLQKLIDYAKSNELVKFAIWTSAEPVAARGLVQKLFGSKIDFEFVYDRRHCSNAPLGVKSKKVAKNLDVVFKNYPGVWNERNTILVDDSASKLRKHPLNLLLTDTFDVGNFDCNSDEANIRIIEWLEKLQSRLDVLKSSDIRDVVSNHKLGE